MKAGTRGKKCTSQDVRMVLLALIRRPTPDRPLMENSTCSIQS